jgi:hypothetical protein
MRKLALTLAVALAAALALAQEPQPQAQPAPPGTGAETKSTATDVKAKDKQMTVVVISTDAPAKTITVKRDADPLLDEAESQKTLAVDAKAIASLKGVHVGEKVTLHVKTDALGKETVTIIEKPATSAPEKQ